MEALAEGVGDEDAVKGIAVKGGQLVQMPYFFVLDRVVFDVVQADTIADNFPGSAGQRQFSQIVFDLDFPTGGLMEDDTIFRILQSRTKVRSQFVRIIDEPEEGAGIEQDIHGFRDGRGSGIKAFGDGLIGIEKIGSDGALAFHLAQATLAGSGGMRERTKLGKGDVPVTQYDGFTGFHAVRIF